MEPILTKISYQYLDIIVISVEKYLSISSIYIVTKRQHIRQKYLIVIPVLHNSTEKITTSVL
jgi:hypothetical protein